MVADVGVGDVGGFDLFDSLDEEDDQREEEDFVGGLQDELEEGLVENFLGCEDTDEGYGEEDGGVDSLTSHGAEEVATIQLRLLAACLATAHDKGVEEAATEESDEGGHGDARREAEDGVGALVVGPILGTGHNIDQRRGGYEEEVHHEAHPDEHDGLAVAPHLADNLDDDVAEGEGEHASGDVDGAKGNLLGLEDVGGDEHHGEEQALLQVADAQFGKVCSVFHKTSQLNDASITQTALFLLPLQHGEMKMDLANPNIVRIFAHKLKSIYKPVKTNTL